jgi:outer membrane receptor for ferrienterochelin and colicin
MRRKLFLIIFWVGAVWVLCTGQVRPDNIEISYKAIQKPLKLVLKDISNIAGVSIAYSENRLPSDKAVSVSVLNERVGEILKSILNPFYFSYELVGNQIVLIPFGTSYSKVNFTIFGYVRDKNTGEALIGANVFIPDKSAGTSTNENGFFSFKLPHGIDRLYFSYLGYRQEAISCRLHRDSSVNIMMKPDGRLHEIVVQENILEEGHETAGDIQKLHIDKILAGNHLAGEADVMRYLNVLPGVSSAADGIGGLSIRGGSPDQNLVLIDGVPLYNPGHALGVFSIFNSNIIKSVSLVKGGVPARYGGRLSSVLDIHTRDGNMNQMSGEMSLSTIAFKGSLEGPLKKGKSSYLLSYRRTYMDVWLNELNRYLLSGTNKTANTGYYFQDVNLKLNFNPGTKHKIQFNFYSGNDDFINELSASSQLLNDKEINKVNWGNTMLSARWSAEMSNNVFTRFTAYHTSFSFDRYFLNSFQREEVNNSIAFLNAGIHSSGVYESGTQFDLDWMPHQNHFIKSGVAVRYRGFSPLSMQIVGNPVKEPELHDLATEEAIRSTYGRINTKFGELNAYVEDQWRISGNTRVNVGFHSSGLISEDGVQYFSLQPRLSFITGNDFLHLKAGASRMQQFLHLLGNNGPGLPSDLWIASDKKLRPSNSWLFNTGIGFRNQAGYKMGIDVYYKIFTDLISVREGVDLQVHQNALWQEGIPDGSGNAYGFECFIEKLTGNNLFNLNYSFTVADRFFNALNNGNSFPYHLNRLHNLKFSMTHRLSGFTELVLNWNVSSGNHYTSPSNESVILEDNLVLLYLEKNNSRFPVYHRLDAGVSFYNSYRWGRSKLFIGVYNAYNRRNPFYADIRRVREDPERFEFRQVSLLPVLPAISYQISW